MEEDLEEEGEEEEEDEEEREAAKRESITGDEVDAVAGAAFFVCLNRRLGEAVGVFTPPPADLDRRE